MTRGAILSVLIPVRAFDASFALDRLGSRRSLIDDGIEIVVTDDGSAIDIARQIERFCENAGWVYHRLDSVDSPFSLARARNAGLEKAAGGNVFFDDLDMVYPNDFFQRVVRELSLLETTPLDFLSFPAIYLSEEASRSVLQEGIEAHAPALLTSALLEDPRGHPANRMIDSFSPASAILAMAKQVALLCGGFDENFQGWGGEDRDFIFRLLARNDRLPRPAGFSQTRLTNLNDTHAFEGWRSLLKLHGDYASRKGLYAFHLHHPVNSWRKDRSNIEEAARRALDHPLEEQDPAFVSEREALRRSTLFSSLSLGEGEGPASPASRKRGDTSARFRKLRRDPHGYFRDARFPFSTTISKLFRPRTNVVD